MEGGVEKFVSFPYLVYVIIGLAVSPAIEYLFKYVDIVLSYQETLDSLTATKENLTTIIPLLQEQYPSDDIERQGSSAESAVKIWADKLQKLHGDGSAKEPNIARINVVSRYRETNKMKQKISEMEKHLKLFPLIQLELLLMCQGVGHPADIDPEYPRDNPAGIDPEYRRDNPGDFVGKVVTGFMKRAAKSILGRMKMVIHFNREVASLKHLVTSIMPIVHEISEIPRLVAYPTINDWFKNMSTHLKEAGEIKSLPWWNVIRRYKDTNDAPNLISTIEAHVNSASLVSLEPLFQELPQKKHRPSASVISLEPASVMRLESAVGINDYIPYLGSCAIS